MAINKALTFRPKLIDTLKTYNRQQLYKDVIAGIVVGIVAIPLAIAFAIACGVSPEKGLITAIIAGFIISALGGSRVQIGGPTGAFIVIVYGIVQQYGVNGLIIATFLAGILLLIMGIARFGSVIKFIPHPLIVGFTTGIAVIIFSSEVKDFLGLSMGTVPAPFIDKWRAFAGHLGSTNIEALVLGLVTVVITALWPRITHRIPGSLIAILVTTTVAWYFRLPVETIGSRFGKISASFPAPVIPYVSWKVVRSLIQPAFTIALLGGIESLLSAVVSDGMIGGNHRSNTELIAQGFANMGSAIFGGIPATGAIARTVTNIKNGGRTPVAGIVHSITLLIILLLVGSLAALIPLATLAGILIVVAYNMSEWRNFVSILNGSRSDAAVLLVTFSLTVLVNLTVAIEVGIVLAAFLFMKEMTQFTNVRPITQHMEDEPETADDLAISNYALPDSVAVYEINGPMFFGAAYKFKEAIRIIEKKPRILIIRMRNVPIIDATGIHTLKGVEHDCRREGTKLILSGITSRQVIEELNNSRLSFKIGKGNIVEDFAAAIERSKQILNDS